MAPTTIVSEIEALFLERGHSQYGGEAVSQLQHGLQAAALAEQEGASSQLIAAALLHDVGHLLHDLPDDSPDRGTDDAHERLGAEWLRSRFPPGVLELVRMHVDAKRFLCATDANYRRSLSGPSELSLQLQGGPMSADECAAFRDNDYFKDAVRLRRWDDLAKDPDFVTPALAHFLQHVHDSLIPHSTPSSDRSEHA